MKIVVFEADERDRKGFTELAREHDVVFTNEPLQSGAPVPHGDAEAISVFVYSRIGEDVLAGMPWLRLIATRSTGYDHIDLEACRRRGVAVCNVPNYGANTVAEHVFALLLAISHRLFEARARARSGSFSPDGLVGFDLAGRTLGVIGAGNIGRNVIQIGLGFGMRVVAYDPNPGLALALHERFSYAGFDELLQCADVISLHVPATAENNHLLSRDAFARMKDGVVIINTARGSLIDSPALIAGLRSGKVAAAGLDVLPDEPLIRDEAEMIESLFAKHHDLRDLVADHVLLHMPNVVVTPHTAYLTHEALGRIVATTAANISAFCSGQQRNLLVPPAQAFA